jgi:hypothetical protein
MTKVAENISYLQRSQLKSIALNPQTMALQFRFTEVEGKPDQDVELELLGIAQVNLAKDLEDEEMLAIVGEARMASITDGGRAIFEKLHYPFRSLEHESAPFSYPDLELFHFHLEGDICADVVCKEYRLKEFARSSISRVET